MCFPSSSQMSRALLAFVMAKSAIFKRAGARSVNGVSKYSARLFNMMLCILVGTLVSQSLFADQPVGNLSGQTNQGAEQADPLDELTPEAVAAVDALRNQLPADSEAIAMLDSILSGRRLGAEDGWFPIAKSQTRFDWDYVLEIYDKNQDRTVDKAEFAGSENDFTRLDCTPDKKLTEADFD